MPSPCYLVTGASRGIGRAVAVALANRDCQVVAVARSGELLQEMANDPSGRIRAVAADISKTTGLDNLVSQAAKFAVTGIVHCAGSLVPVEPLHDLRESSLTDHFRVHVAAPIELTRRFVRQHAVHQLVYIDSYSATTAREGWSAYSIVKAAAQMAARCAALEFKTANVIRVFPGAVRTQVVDAVLASNSKAGEAFQEILNRGELAEPEEVADFIARILRDVDDATLQSKESWDFRVPADRRLVGL